MSVFDHEDYKAFVLEQIAEKPNAGRGVRRQLAEFIGCQVAYVSHVLAADRHFSPEQAEAAARFFSLREDESEFFLLLVDSQRAGTLDLRKYLQRRLDQRRREYREIKKRIRVSRAIAPVDQAQYYSSWHYQAVHTLLTIPEFRVPAALVERLKLPPERVNAVLTFLLEKGLVQESAHGYVPTETQIHLPRSSPLIGKLHGNWRVQTLGVLDRERDDDYHYSGLVTLSRNDALKVREILTRALAQTMELVKPSKEETMCLVAMDFYEI